MTTEVWGKLGAFGGAAGERAPFLRSCVQEKEKGKSARPSTSGEHFQRVNIEGHGWDGMGCDGMEGGGGTKVNVERR